jgi:hypothetical protein
MQHRKPSALLAARGWSNADLYRIQHWLRWLAIASVLAFIILGAEGARWWAVRASWAFVAVLALNLAIAVPVQLLVIHRAWTARRLSRQALGEAYDEIIEARKRRSE